MVACACDGCGETSVLVGLLEVEFECLEHYLSGCFAVPFAACFGEETSLVNDVVPCANVDDFVLLVTSHTGEGAGFGELGE